jgi:hypothetical protein
MRAGLYTTAKPTQTTSLAVSTWLSPLLQARPKMSFKFQKLTQRIHETRLSRTKLKQEITFNYLALQ